MLNVEVDLMVGVFSNHIQHKLLVWFLLVLHFHIPHSWTSPLQKRACSGIDIKCPVNHGVQVPAPASSLGLRVRLYALGLYIIHMLLTCLQATCSWYAKNYLEPPSTSCWVWFLSASEQWFLFQVLKREALATTIGVAQPHTVWKIIPILIQVNTHSSKSWQSHPFIYYKIYGHFGPFHPHTYME